MHNPIPDVDLTCLAEGKTKVIYSISDNPNIVLVASKDDITAGDGARHDVIPGKGKWANQTACNVFRHLESHGVPVAFDHQFYHNSFMAHRCRMLPFEVIVRREAHFSFLKRNPLVEKGRRFDPLLIEFHLKTSGRQWQGVALPVDDPFLIFEGGRGLVHLFHPGRPTTDGMEITSLPIASVMDRANYAEVLDEMRAAAVRVFLILEDEWKKVGGTLLDLKVEFGFQFVAGKETRNLLLADVIDNDSWRVLIDGKHVDKQFYRDGGALDAVAERYRQVMDLTGQFGR